MRILSRGLGVLRPETGAKIEDIPRDPFSGIGKPQPQRHLAGGAWCQWVTQEHQIVYRVSGDRIDFLQARYHY